MLMMSLSPEQVTIGHKLKSQQVTSTPGEHLGRRLPQHKSSPGGRAATGVPLRPQDEMSNHMERTGTRTPSKGDSDSSLPSPIMEQSLSSDMEASGEESDPQLCPGKTTVWIVKRHVDKVKIFKFLFFSSHNISL